MRPGLADGATRRHALVAAQVVENDDVARPQRWREKLHDPRQERRPVDRPAEHARRGGAVERRAARKVMVVQRRCGTAAIRRRPRSARPCGRVMLVLAQVSAMNTKRAGSTRPWCCVQRARLRAMSGQFRPPRALSGQEPPRPGPGASPARAAEPHAACRPSAWPRSHPSWCAAASSGPRLLRRDRAGGRAHAGTDLPQ